MLFEDLMYAFSIYTLRTNVSKTSLSPISDLERIFPYNIKLTRDVEKRKIATRGLLVDPIPNYPHCYYENCIADSKENY